MGALSREASGNDPYIDHDLLSTRSGTGLRPWTEPTCRQRSATINVHTSTSSKASAKTAEDYG